MAQHSRSEGCANNNESNVGLSSSDSALAVPQIHTLLLFGCRKRTCDYLYSGDWKRLGVEISDSSLKSGSMCANVFRSDLQINEEMGEDRDKKMITDRGKDRDEDAGCANSQIEIQIGNNSTSIGVLTAFSQDQPQKHYVTHLIVEHAAHIWAMISKGGAIFISGTAKNMPQDVRTALLKVFL